MAPLNPSEIVLGVLLQVLFTAALGAWGTWVARRNGDTRFWRLARLTPWVALALLTVGTILAVSLLNRAFEATQTTDAANKATALARGVSGAMNLSAVFFVPGYALLAFAVVAFAIGSLRAPRA